MGPLCDYLTTARLWDYGAIVRLWGLWDHCATMGSGATLGLWDYGTNVRLWFVGLLYDYGTLGPLCDYGTMGSLCDYATMGPL